GCVLAGITDLASDDVGDRALLVSVGACLGKRVVEVRPDRALGCGRRQRVTRPALGDEELLAGVLVAARHDAARATPRQRDCACSERGGTPDSTQAAGRLAHAASKR